MGLHSKVPSWVAAGLTDEVRCIIKPVVPSSWLYGIAHEIPWCCAKLQELKEGAQSIILSASDCPAILFQDQQKVKTQAPEGVVPMLYIAIQELEAWAQSASHLREAASKTSSELTTSMMRDYLSCSPEQHWRALEGAIALCATVSGNVCEEPRWGKNEYQLTTPSHEAPVCCFGHPGALSWLDGSGGGKENLKCKWLQGQTQRGMRRDILQQREATSWTYHFISMQLFLRQKEPLIPLKKVHPNEDRNKWS